MKKTIMRMGMFTKFLIEILLVIIFFVLYTNTVFAQIERQQQAMKLEPNFSRGICWDNCKTSFDNCVNAKTNKNTCLSQQSSCEKYCD